MDIQINLERAIHQLVDEFLTEPYRFFTEADAVSRFHQLLEADRILNGRVQSKDGIALSMIHQEYPTFFHVNDSVPVGVRRDSQPKAGLDVSTGSRRNHYDIAILTPGFIRRHTAETLRNRQITREWASNIQPFQAVVEFKLDDRDWSSGKTRGANAEMGKLILSREDAKLRYFVGMMRYTAPTENRWNKYWPEVTQAAMDHLDIRSLFATYRLLAERPAHVQSFGDWVNTYEEQKRVTLSIHASKTRSGIKSPS